MNARVFLKLFGNLIKFMGALLIVPGAVAAYYGEPAGVVSFALTAFIAMISGMVLERLGEDGKMGVKEGFALVAFGWLGVALLGALPYVFCGTGVIDALFESMSGFTTTGASILTEYNDQGYWIVNATLADHSVATIVSRAVGTILLDAFHGPAATAANATLNLTGSAINATINASQNVSLNVSPGHADWLGRVELSSWARASRPISACSSGGRSHSGLAGWGSSSYS